MATRSSPARHTTTSGAANCATPCDAAIIELVSSPLDDLNASLAAADLGCAESDAARCARLGGARLAGANFAAATLVGASFRRAGDEMPVVPCAEATGMVAGTSFASADLSGADLRGLDLRHTDFAQSAVFDDSFIEHGLDGAELVRQRHLAATRLLKISRRIARRFIHGIDHAWSLPETRPDANHRWKKLSSIHSPVIDQLFGEDRRSESTEYRSQQTNTDRLR